MAEQKRRTGNSHINKRRPIPRHVIDEAGLRAAMEEYCVSPSSLVLGAYRNLSRTKAVAGAALAALYPLLVIILRHAPCAELPMAVLQKIFKAVLEKSPEVNYENMAPAAFCTFYAERVVTLLAHVRRLQNEQRFKEASGNVSSESAAKLRALAAMVDRRGLADSAAPAADASAPPARKLKREVSGVSVDSEGFPRMLGQAEVKSPRRALRQHLPHLDSDFLHETLQDLEKRKNQLAAEHVEEDDLLPEADADEEDPAAAFSSAAPVSKKPAGTGHRRKAAQTKTKSSAAAWKKLTYIRQSGKQKGEKYYEWVGPDGQRHRSLKPAEAAGFKAE